MSYHIDAGRYEVKLNGEKVRLSRMADGRVIWIREAPKCYLVLKGTAWHPLEKKTPPHLISEAVPLTEQETSDIILKEACYQIAGKDGSVSDHPPKPSIDLEGMNLEKALKAMPEGTRVVGGV